MEDKSKQVTTLDTKDRATLPDYKLTSILYSQKMEALKNGIQLLRKDQTYLAAEVKKITNDSLKDLQSFDNKYKVWKSAYLKECSDHKKMREGLEVRGSIRVCNESGSSMANAEINSVIVPKVDSEMEGVLNLLKVEADFTKRLAGVVTEYRNNLSIFIGFLSVLYAISLPCSTVGLCIWLVVLGCVGICVFGGLGVYQIWKIGNEVKTVAHIYKSQRNPNYAKQVCRTTFGREALKDGDSAANERLINSGTDNMDVEKGDGGRHMAAPWHFTWLFFLNMAVLIIFSLSFSIFLGIYIHSKKCATVNQPGLLSIYYRA